MSKDWTEIEVKNTVHSYFKMLVLELNGERYNKAAFRRELKMSLNNRGDGAVEFKHQNISAILIKYGMPYILGYKPFGNYQKLLENEVLNYLSFNPQLDDVFENFSSTISGNEKADVTRFEDWEESPPVFKADISKEIEYSPKIRKVNYLEKEQRDIILGNAGEELAFEFEKWRLKNSGKGKSIDKVEWISRIHGDGAGYDIKSVNEDGSNRFIEVKTTKLGKDAPIFFSINELRFSQKNIDSFYLYRIFQFGRGAKIFIKNGSLDLVCQVEPINFIGKF